MVANGHHWDPRWPEPAFPGSDTFEGEQIHSHSYTDESQLAGRDVVVLGMGNSAMDIAVDASYHANATYLAARRGAHVDPQVRVRQADRHARGERPRARRAAPVDDARGAQVADRRHHELRAARAGPQAGRGPPDGLRADPRPARARRRSRRSRTSRRSRATACGSRTGRRCTPTWSSTARATRSRSRSSIPTSSPRATTSCASTSGSSTRGSAGLYFLGLVQPLGALMPIAERQSQLIARHLTGAYALPSRDAMERDIDAKQRGDAQALRRLEAAHDPGRLRGVHARAREGDGPRRSASAASSSRLILT